MDEQQLAAIAARYQEMAACNPRVQAFIGVRTEDPETGDPFWGIGPPGVTLGYDVRVDIESVPEADELLAEFIVYSFRDLPALLAEVRRLQAERDRLRATLAVYGDEDNWFQTGYGFYMPVTHEHDGLMPLDKPWLLAQQAVAEEEA